MLATDNPRSMGPLQEFIRNNRGINNGENLPSAILEALYSLPSPPLRVPLPPARPL